MMGEGSRLRHMVAAMSVAALLGIAASGTAQNRPQRPIYKDPSQPVERRVDDLLARVWT